jgi:hypothetical protein
MLDSFLSLNQAAWPQDLAGLHTSQIRTLIIPAFFYF